MVSGACSGCKPDTMMGSLLIFTRGFNRFIQVAGRDLREKVTEEEGSLIKTCVFMDRSYVMSFKGEDLLHWMVSNCWAAHAAEAISIAQLLLTHSVLVNGRLQRVTQSSPGLFFPLHRMLHFVHP